MTNTDDTSARGANPDKIGVYSTGSDTASSTGSAGAGSAGTGTASTSSMGTASTAHGSTATAGDANRKASAATAASPAKWIIPAVVVVLIILALLYLF